MWILQKFYTAVFHQIQRLPLANSIPRQYVYKKALLKGSGLGPWEVTNAKNGVTWGLATMLYTDTHVI